MKFIKRLTVLILAGLMGLSLISCKALDERKARNAYWADDSHESIDWQGEKFVLTKAEVPEGFNFRLSGETVWVNEPGVPVLLDMREGSAFTTDEKHRFLCSSGSFYFEIFRYSQDPGLPEHYLYIREDVKEEMEALLKEAKIDHFCLDLSLASGDKTVLLPEETQKLMDEIFRTEKKISFTDLGEYPGLEEIMYNFQDEISLYPCDASMILFKGYVSVYYREEEGKKEALICLDDGEESFYMKDPDLTLYKALKDVKDQQLKRR